MFVAFQTSERDFSQKILDTISCFHHNITMEDLLKSIDSNMELKRFLEKLSASAWMAWSWLGSVRFDYIRYCGN